VGTTNLFGATPNGNMPIIKKSVISVLTGAGSENGKSITQATSALN
jgi:hypothetical protein